MEQQKQDETGGMEECLLCRITYSIYSNFPPMPSTMALKAETGEWFAFDTLKPYRTGYDMAEALGYAWACDCRGRSRNRFDQQFTLRDSDGHAVPDTFYTVRFPSGELKHGVTDHAGRTARYRTSVRQQLAVYLGHKDA
ncbi:hypothetical protein BJG93_19590 [Paraburkholderia sprentiae WSM5005]|uniref:Uncharacterized protein n=1 Tax=Paraburkholderia sprentiae WSM5005 TaxID=754502 RepID=A0A1I9YMZ2_9BURK|nr:hypothetical protein [Paraburkholderia sprentiae]APA87675.1 hypothetical protein BJG93_19590 [Paraburkholderia sprentiae WSM5005]